jgi:hypothetical protein
MAIAMAIMPPSLPKLARVAPTAIIIPATP